MENHQSQSRSAFIAIALMVKNEAISIQSLLSSLSNEGIHHFFILDTGSNDNTMELAQAFFQQHELDGYIKQEPFIDFSASRNRTIELAEQQFPHIPFLLMPDAEWHLHQVQSLIHFCEQEQHRDTPLYLIKMKMNSVEFAAARLFRTSSRVRFNGVVHEVPNVVAQLKVPDPVYFEVKASVEGIQKSHRRWQQDLVLLSKAYAKNPHDPRTLFYLAQTYECLDKLEEAYRFYQYREKLNGWDEENFITLLRLGCLAERLSQTHAAYDWATAKKYFLKAFSLRSHRIEPLVKLANHYWPKDIPACYFFIRHAYDIPYPKLDLLFIDKEMYEYSRYEIMSRCAWYMGEFALGEQATQLALKIHPNMEHLHKNLEIYQQTLNSILLGTEKTRF